MEFEKEFETNRDSWNRKVGIHAKSAFYDMESFNKGSSSLNRFELEALGDVSGKSILHLQCHFGQDTLSWSRMGAQCTGVDISDTAIQLARELASEMNIDAQFVCCNVLDTSEYISDIFDIVFTSYGTIGWLPDLMPWAQMIAARLKPEGIFHIVEFHPIVWMFDYTQDNPKMVYGYQQEEAIYEEYQGTYADMSADIVSKEYGWNHGLGQVVTALSKAGLRIDFLREHYESPYNVFPGLVRNSEGMYVLPNGLYPLLFEIKASKPAFPATI